MQNEEVQGEYLRLMQRKKFFPYKEQNLRNFSLVLSMQAFTSRLNTDLFNQNSLLNKNLINKLCSQSEKAAEKKFTKNKIQENYKNCFNFNKLEILECFDEQTPAIQHKRKLSSTVLNRLKIADKRKFLKKFSVNKQSASLKEDTVISAVYPLDMVNEFNNRHKNASNERTAENNPNKILKIQINFFNKQLKDKLDLLLAKDNTIINPKEKIEKFVDCLYQDFKFVEEKIRLWNKKSLSYNDDFASDWDIIPEDKRRFYKEYEKINLKFFNNFFISIFENENTNKAQSFLGKKANHTAYLNTKSDFFLDAQLDLQVTSQLTDKIVPQEKLLEILKSKKNFDSLVNVNNSKVPLGDRNNNNNNTNNRNSTISDNVNPLADNPELDVGFLNKLKNMKELELKFENLNEIYNLNIFDNLAKIDLGSNKLTNLNFLESLNPSRISQSAENKQSNSIEEEKANMENNRMNNSTPCISNNKNSSIANPKKQIQNSKENCFRLRNILTEVFIQNKFEKILELNFCQNKIKYIDKEIFNKLTNLRILNLEINEINKIENLEKCIFLNNLNLNYNKIEQIENLECLINLERLNLTGNQIKKLEKLATLKRMKYLYLGGNKLKDLDNIENEVFYLEELILYDNRIKDLPENFSLPFLKSLYLNSNKLKQIRNFFLPNLEELFLQDNKILTISASNQLISYSKKLKKIDLSFNKFENFTEIIFFLSDFKSLQSIKLNNNPFYMNLNNIIDIQTTLMRLFPKLKDQDIENIISNNKNKEKKQVQSYLDNEKNKLVVRYPNMTSTINILNNDYNEALTDNIISFSKPEFEHIRNMSSNSTSLDSSKNNSNFLNLDFKSNDNLSTIIIKHLFDKEEETININSKINNDDCHNHKNTENKIPILSNSEINSNKASILNDEAREDEEKDFELFYEILLAKERKAENFQKNLEHLMSYFNIQHSSFLNLFTSKFQAANFFGKGLAFNKSNALEKFYLSDILNNNYSKAKSKFIFLLAEILSENHKFKEDSEILHQKFNEHQINEESFRKYIFNLKNIFEFLSNNVKNFISNFRSRKGKIIKIQNNFRGAKLRKLLYAQVKGFNYLKNINKILRIQKTFKKKFYKKKFWNNYEKLRFEDESNLDDNVPNFFLDEDNLDIEDSYLRNLNSNKVPGELHMSVINELPELEQENKINLNNEISISNPKRLKDPNVIDFANQENNNSANTKNILSGDKTESEILNKIKTLEKSIKINEKLEKQKLLTLNGNNIHNIKASDYSSNNNINNEDLKIKYNLNIGLNLKQLAPLKTNNNNDSNIYNAPTIVNKVGLIGHGNNSKMKLNKMEANINFVDMNNIEFLADANKFNEKKVVFREISNYNNNNSSTNLVNNNNNNNNIINIDKPFLPNIKSNKMLNEEREQTSSISGNTVRLPAIKNNQKKLQTPVSLHSEESIRFNSNIRLRSNSKNKESNSLSSSNDNFSVKNYSQFSNKNSNLNNQENNLDKSYKSNTKRSDSIYIGGRLLPTKVVEEIRVIEHECREAIKNAKAEWNLQNHLAEELLVKKIKKQYKKRIEKLINNHQN